MKNLEPNSQPLFFLFILESKVASPKQVTVCVATPLCVEPTWAGSRGDGAEEVSRPVCKEVMGRVGVAPGCRGNHLSSLSAAKHTESQQSALRLRNDGEQPDARIGCPVLAEGVDQQHLGARYPGEGIGLNPATAAVRKLLVLWQAEHRERHYYKIKHLIVAYPDTEIEFACKAHSS